MAKNFSSNLNRRRFLQISAGSSVLFGLGPLLSRLPGAAETSDLPNIVILVSDEERHWSRTEALIPSELLDSYHTLIPGRMQLRSQGVRFNNYFTPTAPCSPARGVLYTGHHTVDNGIVDNLDFDEQASLNRNVPTMADVMGAAGYYCAYKGKVHLAKDDVLDGESGADNMLSYYGFHDWQGPTRLGDSEGPLAGALRDFDIAGYAEEWLATTGVDKNNAQTPFLLAVNFINPHDIMLVDVDGMNGDYQLQQGDSSTGDMVFPLAPIPRTPSYLFWWNPKKPANGDGVNGYSIDTAGPRPANQDEWASLLSAWFGNITLADDVKTKIQVYKDNTNPLLGTKTISVPLWQVYLNYYLNCIIDNDRAVLRVINAVKDLNLTNNTLIIITADHGELALSHMGKSRYFQAAATTEAETAEEALAQAPVVMPFRQKGPFVYHENNQLPFVVARLSNKKGSVAKQYLPHVDVDVPVLASSVDLIPTLLSLAGKDGAWYTAQFGAVLTTHNMLDHLPGVSLNSVLQAPGHYQTAQWSDGEQGRDWVLFTCDTVISSLDADYNYKEAWGQDTGCGVDLTKRGCLRGLYDGTYKYVRYFSPLDYQLNSFRYADRDYTHLTQYKHGQDIQVFNHSADGGELETYNSAADQGAPVRDLNVLLYQAMTQELARVDKPPKTVGLVIKNEKTCMAG